MPRLTRLLSIAIVAAACANGGTADSVPATAADSAANSDARAQTPAPPVADVASPSDDTAVAARPTAAAISPVDAMRNRDTVGNALPTGAPAAAGDPIEPSGTPPTDTAAVPGSQPQDPARLLRGTAAIYSAMNSMRAEFAMFTQNPLLRTRVNSSGTLYQRRPDRIKLDFTDPAGDVIVGDGSYFWVFYPSVDPKQVIRTPAAGTAGVVDLQAQFVGDPLQRFDHTVDGHEAVAGRNATIISLVPREDIGYSKLKVWIDDQDFLVRRFEITDPSGVTRLLDLHDLTVDPPLPDGLFEFTPPAGVRVVERG